MSSKGVYGYRPEIVLREPEVWERDGSCNGCHAPTVFRMFECGSRSNDSRAGSQFRFCRECTRVLKEEVARG